MSLVRGQPVTATSGWAWGAVLLSLPPDSLAFAEALTHEFHHLVLAAVEDMEGNVWAGMSAGIIRVNPHEFDALAAAGMEMGFDHVAAGPLVRSSYHADEHIPQPEPGIGPLAAG